MYFVCLIILVFIFVPGVLAQSRSVTVYPATEKLGENALMSFTFSPAPGETLAHVVWYKSDADGVKQGDNIIHNLYGNTEPNGRYSLSHNGNLNISDVEVEDTGYYLCEITTDSGNIAEGFSILRVYYLETPSLKQSEISVNENETAIFTCSLLDGVPTPINSTWIKDGGVLDVSDTEKYPQSNTTLEISRVSEVDEGDYQCRAENAAYIGDEGKLSNKGTLSLFRPTSPSTTSIASTSIIAQKCSGSDTSLLVGLTFLSFFLGIFLPSSIFVVLGKMRNSKAQVTKATSRLYEEPAATEATSGHYEQPAVTEATSRDYELPTVSKATPRDGKHLSAYTEYKVEPRPDNKTYEDLKWSYDNPLVYVNVK